MNRRLTRSGAGLRVAAGYARPLASTDAGLASLSRFGLRSHSLEIRYLIGSPSDSHLPTTLHDGWA